MRFFLHRRNSSQELHSTPSKFGIEVDVRTWQGELILQHDPFLPGEQLYKWLDNYEHSGLILNVKEDGLDQLLIAMMREQNITNFLFLDLSFPSLVRLLEAGLSAHVAVRVSEFESAEVLENLPCCPAFVWCDSFTGRWDHLQEVFKHGYENEITTVLVSPELQGRAPDKEISKLMEDLNAYGFQQLAVCTKFPELWL